LPFSSSFRAVCPSAPEWRAGIVAGRRLRGKYDEIRVGFTTLIVPDFAPFWCIWRQIERSQGLADDERRWHGSCKKLLVKTEREAVLP
jgi:hypothetical protein